MKLCKINNFLYIIILLLLLAIFLRVLNNKKIVEKFSNIWRLNSSGQLCNNNGECKNIGILNNNNQICNITGDCLSANPSLEQSSSQPLPTEPVVPNTPIPTEPTVPNTPIPTEPTVPNTPIPTEPTVPGTSISTEPTIPNTPIPTEPTVPNTPIPSEPVVPGTSISTEPTIPESSTKTYQIKITDPDGLNYISVAQNGNFEDKITIANELIVNGALKEKKYQSAGNYTYIEFNNKVTGIVGTIENVDPSLTLSFLNDNDKSGGVELISID
jgi:hypothetical protein